MNIERKILILEFKTWVLLKVERWRKTTQGEIIRFIFDSGKMDYIDKRGGIWRIFRRGDGFHLRHIKK
jgi:hypothetical protein